MSSAVYFAYGANMHGHLLATRLRRPDAVSFRRRLGILGDHRLVFDKQAASEPEVGYANVVPAPGESVEGVLNDLDTQDLLSLDAIELVPFHYCRQSVTVLDAETSSLVSAAVYVAVAGRTRPNLRPRRDYIEKLLGGTDILSPVYTAWLRGFGDK